MAFDVLSVPGYGHTEKVGSPQLPMKGILLGIPQDSDIEVRDVNEAYSVFSDYTISPVPKAISIENEGTQFPTLEYKYDVDDYVYLSDTFYPGKRYEVKRTGKMRGLHMACIKVYPIQYNPVRKELKLYTKIILQVKFTKRGSVTGRLRPGDPFNETLESTIINYETAKSWIDMRSGKSQIEGEWYQREIESPAFKLLVNEDGVYVLDHSTLLSGGLDLTIIDPRTLKIHNLGEPIPIVVYGEDDGVFDMTDYIEFYGMAMRGMFTDANVYWLSYGYADGLRMDERDGSPGDLIPRQSSFKNHLRLEENYEYWMAIPNGEGLDHWFWKKLETSTPFDIHFNVFNIADTSAECTLKLMFQGKTTDYSIDQDHHILVYLNDRQLPDIWWDGQIPHEDLLTFSQDYLIEGMNTVRFHRPGDTGAVVDIVYVNWLEIEYWDRYMAEDSQLQFTVTGTDREQFEISGFELQDIVLLDITDPTDPVRIRNFIFEDEDSTRTLRFEDDISGTRRYMAITTDKLLFPERTVEDQPSDLSSPVNAADYIVISHDSFYEQCLPLVAWHHKKGLRTELVKLEDVYDEFSYGICDPAAIKNFLSCAYFNWTEPTPSYVLFVGDASFDYKDHFELGKMNYVPTHLMETILLGQTGSDNWFVCVDGNDRLPDLFIGRVCPRSTAQTEAVVNKILHYEGADDVNTWNKHALFVADNEGPFDSYCDLLSEYLPDAYVPQKVYLDDYISSHDATADIISYLNSGCLLATYIGHGNIDNWAGEYMLEPTDIMFLQNGDVLAFVMTMNCLNGYFIDPKDDYCMAEEFLRFEDAGAIGSWSPTNLGYSTHHVAMEEEFLTALFERDSRILGCSTTEAKILAAAGFGFSDLFMDMIDTFILFGDPALELKVLAPRQPQHLVGSPGDGYVDLEWDANSETDLAGYTVYRASELDSEFTQINTSIVLETSYRDTNLTNDLTYMFAVVAEDDVGHESRPSISVSITPGIPTSVTESPRVEILVDGRLFDEGATVQTHPRFRILFSHDHGINPSSAWISIDERRRSIPVSEIHGAGPDEVETLVWFEYRPVLSDGRHRLETGVSSLSGSQCVKEIQFEVVSHLRIDQILNWPNPMVDHTVFTYQLSLPADVTIKIYTMSGRLLKTLRESSDGLYGSTFVWDGRDEDGDRIANGVYLYRIIADNGSEKDEVIQKLIVMR